MIEKISLGLIDESGNFIAIKDATTTQTEIKIEMIIADTFGAICFRNNSIQDQEIKNAEKFHFALNLKKYWEEIKNAD